ncbi:hypothetical protein B7463_g8836, partial [Scytalidium lignicola]
MDEAIADLKSQEEPNYSATALKYGVNQTRQRLNSTQEKVLIGHINRMTDRGMPPTSQIVKNLAEEIIQGPVGKNWVANFLSDGIDRHHIIAENIYNIDEKGFLISVMATSKRILTRKAYETGKAHNTQDGNKEFISILACILATRIALPPGLIYTGESHDLRDNWVQDLKPGDQVYMGASANGWSSNAFGFQWLKRIFEPHTRDLAKGRKRLLIVDGHSSHVNMRFLDFADQHRIIIMILPPYTTYRLQPLDVNMFQPLATEYTNQQNKILHEGFGMVSITKRLFLRMFTVVWLKTFTPEHIRHGFEKTGIYPLNSAKTIAILFPKIESLPSQPIKPPETPLDYLAIRRAQQSYMRSPSSAKLQHIFHCNYKLSAELSISQHYNRGLINSLAFQKQKNQRSRRLNLVGESGEEAQFFSPTRILKAKEVLAQKDAAEQEEKEAKAVCKAVVAIRKAKMEADKVQRQLERQLAREKKACEALEKQQAREEAKVQKAIEQQLQQTQRKARKAITR